MDALKRKKKSRGRSPKPTFQGLPVEKRSHVIATKVEGDQTMTVILDYEDFIRKRSSLLQAHEGC